MGYTTDFFGSFDLSPSLTNEQADYINKFSRTRRMKRDVNKLMELYQGKHGYPYRTGTPEEIYGKDGEFFVGGGGFAGQDRDDSIIDFNTPPGQPTFNELSDMSFSQRLGITEKLIQEGKCQPGLWCQWIVKGVFNEKLEWDEGEKFYNYVEWLRYLITNFFEPWGIKVNGEVEWQGEERDDWGKIVITNNEIKTLLARVEFR
jgi:hypothetical protein